MRFIIPIILIGIAVTSFIMFTNPLYNDIAGQRALVASYDEALNNYQTLDSEKEKLTKKENDIGQDDLAKLKKFLPENVDNIRLILEIEKIAAPYGMVLRDIKYNATEATTANASAGGAVVSTPASVAGGRKAYGIWNLEFSTVGSYDNLINFMKALESNLRVVDISSIQFSSLDNKPDNSVPVYKYNFKIKTYWLKD